MKRLAERLRTGGGVLALIRLAAIPVFFVAERFVDHPNPNSGPFDVLIVLAAVYAAGSLVAELAGRPLAPPRVLAAVDLLGIVVLVATSGGPFSQLRYAFFLVPVGTALLLGARPTALVSAASLVLYATIALTYPDPELERDDWAGFAITQGLFLSWMGVAATLLAGLLTRRTREVERLSASRGRLVGQALDAEGVARRRLAEVLHDDALQNVLAVRQLLESARPSDRDLLLEGLNQGIAQIREAVFDLHPYLLEQAGLRAALRAVADRAGERAGFAAEVAVAPDAEGVHDALLFALGRELIANAAKHAGAARLEVKVTRTNDAVVLAVTDDGRGVDLSRARSAPQRGHIGLASSAERAEAIGGTFKIGPGPDGRGTRAEARLPAPVRTEDHRSQDPASTHGPADRLMPSPSASGSMSGD